MMYPNENNEYENFVPTNNNTPKKEKKGNKKIKKVMSAACLGLVFGVVGATAFQATNVISDKYIKKETPKVVQQTEADSITKGTKLNQSTSTVTSDISQIVEQAMPSVVSITNMSVQEVQDFFGGVRQQEKQSRGSGIIIGQNDKELLLVTNNHVVEGSDTLTVSFIDNTSVKAKLKGTDPKIDLAVVAVPLSDIKPETMNKIKVAALGDSNAIKVGQPVIAIGNALGYGQSVTNGIVSAINRPLGGEDEEQKDKNAFKYIQTNAAINPGNSGGALLNANGEVIGINTVKVSAEAVEGMGYAIPISNVSNVIENLMNKTTREKLSDREQGQLGIRGVDVSADVAKMYNMPQGVYIKDVIKGGGAQKAGIQEGSIITKFDGTSVDSMRSLKERLQYYKVGEKVEITVQVPGGKNAYTEKVFTIVLGKNA